MKMRKKKFDVTHAKIRELIDQGINPFSYYINNKKKHNIKWYFEVRDVAKYMESISPDFKMLWCISGFIKVLEILYMYHNVEDAPIYSILTNKSTIQSFRVNYEDFYIEYTLYEDDFTINCKVVRSWNKESKSEITFEDGQCVMDSRVDEILMFNIIEWTMTRVREVFMEYYKKAKEVKS